MFGCNRQEVTGNWRKFHDKELHGLYYSIAIISVKKLRSVRWALHVNWWFWTVMRMLHFFAVTYPSMSVCILQKFSSPFCIVSGVLQSSIQAPVLLHIFINDLCVKICCHHFLIICWWSENMLSNKSVVCGAKVVSKNDHLTILKMNVIYCTHKTENVYFSYYVVDLLLCINCERSQHYTWWKCISEFLGLLCFITYHFCLLKDFIIFYIALILGACICQVYLQQQQGN